MDVRNINQLPLTRTPTGTDLATPACAPPGIEPMTLQFTGRCSNQLSHTAREPLQVFKQRSIQQPLLLEGGARRLSQML